ncbi:MAG: alanine racemase [Firmicutes bacterium]|jgi:alanine racemase|nr:alanine racemase [Bacillota bacterium]
MRPTWVEVDTDAIADNLRVVRNALPQGAKVMAVVKADGYGHGAVPVAQAAIEAGAEFLGVALVEEGIALRRAGITRPILYMETLFPWQASELVEAGLTATVASFECADLLEEAAARLRRKVPVHIKVDTGMGRLGLSPSEIPALVAHVSRLPHLELEGIFTHLACAECDDDITRQQLGKFSDLLDQLKREGYDIPIAHAANSAAAMQVADSAFDMVRVGAAMYGISPNGTGPLYPGLRPALSFITKVSYVKTVCAGTTVSYGATYRCRCTETIATLPVGYADGYSRALSSKGQVILGGQRRPIVGRVCMDQTMIAVPPDVPVRVGDEVVLIGAQGSERITVEEVAAITGTISYEVVCSISKRVPRVYTGKQQGI